MSDIIFNDNTIQNVYFNGEIVSKVYFNGELIWTADVESDYSWTIASSSYSYYNNNGGTASIVNGTGSYLWIPSGITTSLNQYCSTYGNQILNSEFYNIFLEDIALGHITEWDKESSKYVLFNDGEVTVDWDRYCLKFSWENMGTFTNGIKILARDIVFSIKTALMPGYKGPGRSLRYFLSDNMSLIFNDATSELDNIGSAFALYDDYSFGFYGGNIGFDITDEDKVDQLLMFLSYIPILGFENIDSYFGYNVETGISTYLQGWQSLSNNYKTIGIYYTVDSNSFDYSNTYFSITNSFDVSYINLGEPSFPRSISEWLDCVNNSSIFSYSNSNGEYYSVGDWDGNNLPYLSEDCYIQEWYCYHNPSLGGSNACTKMKELLFSAFLYACEQAYNSSGVPTSSIYICPFVGNSQPYYLTDFLSCGYSVKQLDANMFVTWEAPMSNWSAYWDNEVATTIITEWIGATGVNTIKINQITLNNSAYNIALPYYNNDEDRGYVFLYEGSVWDHFKTLLINCGFPENNIIINNINIGNLQNKQELWDMSNIDSNSFIMGINRLQRDCLGWDYYVDRYAVSGNNILPMFEDQEYNAHYNYQDNGVLYDVIKNGAWSLRGTDQTIGNKLTALTPYLGTWSRIPLSPTTPMFSASVRYGGTNLVSNYDDLYGPNSNWLRARPLLAEDLLYYSPVCVVSASATLV